MSFLHDRFGDCPGHNSYKCCQAADAIDEKSTLPRPVPKTPPVSDHSVTLEPVVEEEKQTSLSKTNIINIVEKDTVEDRSTRSVPIIDSLKQTDASTPSQSGCSATSESVAKEDEEEQSSVTTTSLRSLSLRSTVEPVVNAIKQDTPNTPPASDHSVASEYVAKEEEDEQNSLTGPSVKSILEEDTAQNKSTHSVPIIDKSEQAATNTPPVSERSVDTEYVSKEEKDEQNSMTKPSVRSIADEDTVQDRSTHSGPIIDTPEQTDTITPPFSERSAVSGSVTKEDEEEQNSVTTTSLRSTVEPVVNVNKQDTSNTHPVPDRSVVLTKTNVRSIVEEDIAEKAAQKEANNCFTSFFCCGNNTKTVVKQKKKVSASSPEKSSALIVR